MKLTDVSSQRAVKAFQKAGYRTIRDKGSHIVVEDAGLTEQQFKDLL
jgi:predicted RNA binding protein YcfA (HicA-like mRNA interferase family)